MFKRIATKIPGCYRLEPRVQADHRGTFVKTFHRPAFAELGLATDFEEEYYSVSRLGVLRGLHFQLPPDDHVKIVYCLSGRVLDAVVDLRVGSPTYGSAEVFDLSAASGDLIYIPRGLAHGFLVVSESATLAYKVSTVYSPSRDAGIRWDSVAIPWGVTNPIISERDSGFPRLDQFSSPFSYE